MIYRIIGIKGDSTVDGLDIAFCQLEEAGGKWQYDLLCAKHVPYNAEWQRSIKTARQISVLDYFELDSTFGYFIGEAINQFIDENSLHHQVQLIGSFGQPVIYDAKSRVHATLGSGAAIAAVTGINVISDFHSIDIALGGQGVSLFAMANRLLFPDKKLHLDLVGNATITAALPPAILATRSARSILC